MTKGLRALSGLALLSLLAQPAGAVSLNGKEQARVDRARPKDRDDVRYCLIRKKKGAKTGTIAGAAGGAAVGAIAGHNFGTTALAAGAGALAGNLIGKGTATDKRCDQVLKRNP